MQQKLQHETTKLHQQNKGVKEMLSDLQSKLQSEIDKQQQLSTHAQLKQQQLQT